MGNLKPYSGPFGRAELSHLLRRTLFGLTKADLNFFKGKTLEEVVDSLLTVPKNPPAPPIKTYYSRVNGVNVDNLDPGIPFGSTWVDTPIPKNASPNPNNNRRLNYKLWWTGLQVQQDRNLREKMVLFWHNHLATEATVIGNAQMAYNTNSLLRRYALGRFFDLMYEITIDPGMLIYLNGASNSKKAPDENYARELQELFCLGKGPDSQYTEDDVKAAARVLTGWQVITSENNNNVNPRTIYTNSRHDTTDKVFSGFYGNAVIKGRSGPDVKTGQLSDLKASAAGQELEDLLKLIFSKDEVSKFICRKLFLFFVYYELSPEVESELIEPLAAVFRANQHNPDQMKIVLKALFTSDFFFREKYRGCMIKSPCDFAVGAYRQFGFPFPKEPEKFEALYIYYNHLRNYTVKMGQDIGDPPDVAGWPAYYQLPSFHQIWVDTATYPERKTMYEALSRNNFNTGANTFTEASRNISVKINWVDFVKQFDEPQDPNKLIEEAIQLLFGVGVSDEVKTYLKKTYLLLGQQSDYYWTDAWNKYIANPQTSNPEAKRVPQMLLDLFLYMQSAAEYHLC